MRRLDAHEVVALAVAGLGLYALYRLASASSASSPPLPGAAPPVPPAALPARAGTTPVPPPGVNVALPKDLHPQFWYAGRVELFGTPALTLPTSWLVGTLTTSGFGGSATRPDAPEAAFVPLKVQAFGTPSEAAAAGFPDWSLADAGVGTRWFLGRWTGSVSFTAVPSFVKLMWRADVPRGATGA